MQKAHGTPGIDLADILGFTIGFCFLPSALCLMAVLLLTYFERPGRLDTDNCHKGSGILGFNPAATPEAGQDNAARSGAEPALQSLSRRSVAEPRC